MTERENSRDIIDRLFVSMKIENSFPDEIRPEISHSLNILKERIIREVKEISDEHEGKAITDEDITEAVKRVIPWWKPEPSAAAIENIINKGVLYLIHNCNFSDGLYGGGWGFYRDWIGNLVQSKEQAKQWEKNPPKRIWDTATTIITLLKVGVPQDAEVIQKSIEWLIEQKRNDDGGYPFLPREYWKYLRSVCCPLRSSVYETSYALMALREAGIDTRSPAIMTSLSFLRKTQNQAYGAWGPTPYENISVGATSSAVLAQISVGVDPASHSILKAIQWLKENQREDGGWGENYRGGPGISLVTKTHDAMIALIASGSQQTEVAIRRGVQYLLNIQKLVRSERGEWGWVWSPDVGIEISDIENTATAIIALLRAGQSTDTLTIKMGIQWLLKNRDANGVWGKDTPRVILCLKDYLDKTSFRRCDVKT